MKINSINSINYNNRQPNFKRSAVPYPEFANGYKVDNKSFTEKLVNAINDLFHPEVVSEASKIKSQIDNVYEPIKTNNNPKKCLLSVLA